LSKVLSVPCRRHFSSEEYRASPKIIISADGAGIISQAGAVLLTKSLHVTGLEEQLSAVLQRWRAPRAVHDPGKIVADLAVAVAGSRERGAKDGNPCDRVTPETNYGSSPYH
jgi:hypothetical protein